VGKGFTLRARTAKRHRMVGDIPLLPTLWREIRYRDGRFEGTWLKPEKKSEIPPCDTAGWELWRS
jgi:hypothetical protein